MDNAGQVLRQSRRWRSSYAHCVGKRWIALKRDYRSVGKRTLTTVDFFMRNVPLSLPAFAQRPDRTKAATFCRRSSIPS